MGNVVRPTYKTKSKGKVDAMVSGRGLSLSDFEDGSRGGVVDSSMKAKTVWKIPWRTRNMSAVSLKVLRPHYGLTHELLVGRSITLRTRPKMLDRQRIGQVFSTESTPGDDCGKHS